MTRASCKVFYHDGAEHLIIQKLNIPQYGQKITLGISM